MRKTDKKIDKAIRAVLTEACDIAQEESTGFTWLTHFVNYDNLPKSLSVICIYDTDANLANADLDVMRSLIKAKLASININIKDSSKQIRFDTEEKCNTEHDGNWNKRFG